jgi:hypothetical protein
MEQQVTPPSGTYRSILRDTHPHIRIAFNHTPMYGVSKVPNVDVLRVLDESTNEHAKYYAHGLRSGKMVTIVENQYSHIYYQVGELYFKS